MKLGISLALFIVCAFQNTSAIPIDELIASPHGNCAVDSLYVCLKISGKTFHRELLATELGKNKDASYSATDIISCAKLFNCSMEAYKCDLEDLYSLKPPFIAHVWLEINKVPYDHFLPILKVDPKKGVETVDLNHSLTHPFWIGWKPFKAMFRNSVISLE